MPNLCSFLPKVNPGVFFSTINADMPFIPLLLSVMANTM
ncbi:MAG: hypothetical protein DDT38_01479 [Firmicutes bacterium]|nr:hypothetical protein [candidate division NPL-UPA2 bacterium]